MDEIKDMLLTYEKTNTELKTRLERLEIILEKLN
jgi:hypothetical protein